MHILLGALVVIGVVVYWIYRARMAADATREVIDVADDVRAAVRRFGYRRQAGKHPADLVDDPRLAAAGILAAIAKMDGSLTDAQINALRVEARATFRVDQQEADEIAAYGRWLSDQSNTPDDTIRRLSSVIRREAPADAHRDVVTMAERVASVTDGSANAMQRQAIDRLAHELGLT